MSTSPVAHDHTAVKLLVRWQEMCHARRDVCGWLGSKSRLIPGWFVFLFCFLVNCAGEEARTTLSFCCNLQCPLCHPFRQNDCMVSGDSFTWPLHVLCAADCFLTVWNGEPITMTISRATQILLILTVILTTCEKVTYNWRWITCELP